MDVGSQSPMRNFLRHPCELPVELTIRQRTVLRSQRLYNISLGGAACNSPCSLRRGTTVELQIPVRGGAARYRGVVAWCLPHANGYRFGLSFVDDDILLRARTVEQLCQSNAPTRPYSRRERP
ncbi:MAG: hypothetical protein GAK45_01136 [Pseudomonas citronellolis]|nr:MAG: hypothetical protein GAK45_01136 [Pseudomonas citronellolis]